MPTAKAQPKALERLITKLTSDIQATTNDLADGTTEVDVWRDEMAQALTKFHGAAYLAGARQTTLDELARKRIAGDVRVQLQYLDKFALEIQDAETFEAGWQARAESYALSIKQPYWEGRTKMLPLPAMPGQGTDCHGNCRCLWSIDTLDSEAGDYDCYWIRGAKDSCATCIERADQWSPLQVRSGVLQ